VFNFAGIVVDVSVLVFPQNELFLYEIGIISNQGECSWNVQVWVTLVLTLI